VIENFLLKFKAESQEFEKILRSLKQFVRTLKGQTIFGSRMLFCFVPGGFSDKVLFKKIRTSTVTTILVRFFMNKSLYIIN